MNHFFKKTLISMIGLSIALNPLFVLVPEKAKADDPTSDYYVSHPDNEDDLNTGTALIDISNQDSYDYTTPPVTLDENNITNSAAYDDITGILSQ